MKTGNDMVLDFFVILDVLLTIALDTPHASTINELYVLP